MKFLSWVRKSCGFKKFNKGPLVLTNRTILSVAMEMFMSSSRLKCLFFAFLLNYSLQWPAGETCLSSITLNSFTSLRPVRGKKKKKKKRGQHQPSFHSNSKIECRGNKRVPPTSLQGPSPNTSGGGVAGASPPPQRDHRGENKLGCLSPGASCRERGEEREIEEGGREGGVCMRAGPGFPYLLIVLLDGCPKTVMWKRSTGWGGGKEPHCVPADPVVLPISLQGSFRSLIFDMTVWL